MSTEHPVGGGRKGKGVGNLNAARSVLPALKRLRQGKPLPASLARVAALADREAELLISDKGGRDAMTGGEQLMLGIWRTARTAVLLILNELVERGAVAVDNGTWDLQPGVARLAKFLGLGEHRPDVGEGHTHRPGVLRDQRKHGLFPAGEVAAVVPAEGLIHEGRSEEPFRFPTTRTSHHHQAARVGAGLVLVPGDGLETLRVLRIRHREGVGGGEDAPLGHRESDPQDVLGELQDREARDQGGH